MSLISTIALLALAVVLIGVITLVIRGQWMLLDVAREQGLTEAYNLSHKKSLTRNFTKT